MIPRLATHELRSADGEAVTWLHGYTMNSDVWANLWSRLPGHHIGVDLPGHGASRPGSPADDLSAVAREVARVMAEHGSRTLVAMSFGSSVGLQVAIDHPELVARLVLAAPTISEPAVDDAARDRMTQLVRAKAAGMRPSWLTQIWMSAPPDIFTGLHSHPARLAAVRAVVEAHSYDELLSGSMGGMFASVQTEEDLARIAAATLVIVGEQDMPRFVTNADRLRAAVPRCRVRRIQDAGHLPLLELPEVCAPLIAEFLPSAVALAPSSA
ncbi:alpha/beta fold hydrolase [Luteipulveratus mongoliensis]|uniref:AB hydrolase-1 domain-containing protein n=1 Tax=Luteipulveratus mongoliensis TaxID=571913 RepID=A0A0K1JFX2_9MICO|nr:alpha/beta hydrolase [Luteipulveratus mongoliensis]AKU15601.1 hypothetical protein VV02_06595 [Luteipulveratus mongoliensis]